MKKILILLFAGISLFLWELYPAFVDTPADAPSLNASMAQDDIQFAQRFFALAGSRNYAQIQKMLDTKYIKMDEQLKQAIDMLAAHLPKEEPKNLKVIAVRIITQEGSIQESLNYECEFSHQWALFDITLIKQGNTVLVQGFHFTQLQDSLERLSRFTLRNQSTEFYLVFTLATLLALTQIYILILFFYTNVPKNKWLWFAFILAGTLSVTYSTSVYGIYIGLNFPPFFIYQGPYQSGILLQIPLGGLIFLSRRRKWMAAG